MRQNGCQAVTLAEYRKYFNMSPVIQPVLLPSYEHMLSVVLLGNLTQSSVNTKGAVAFNRHAANPSEE